MRTAIGLGSMAAVLAASPAQAAMPLHVQRRGDLRQIIDMPALGRFGPVERIELIAPRLWRVTSGRCHIDVRMVERSGPYPGRGLSPLQLEPHPGRPVCQR
jgi:hypothetical protein